MFADAAVGQAPGHTKVDDVLRIDGKGLGLRCWDRGGFGFGGLALGVVVRSVDDVQVGGVSALAVDVVLHDFGLQYCPLFFDEFGYSLQLVSAVAAHAVDLIGDGQVLL